ncbi:hypothetical protein PPERSA_06776 [Pseudocohnilembus persalinus]|uniref:EF-hand domain-containing protein n=1 Tax=Pseudocohnilembus persalinus TaxID=266149 RepID=A0A0V0QSC8_PSEPJ|nr:hypothetical protein PPERSA_06776 [Pseudocohnilembus persalinus]|eukprot:KRX05142.1 hypothetical protein PPERSA_06776 [Pseudocohnilembus persalinus]
MSIRKNRIVQCGTQNKDYRTNHNLSLSGSMNYTPSIELLSTAKSNRINKNIKKQLDSLDPLTQTKQFYSSLNKNSTQKIPLFRHQEDEQELQRQKEQLPGDSYLTFTRKPKFEKVVGVFRSLNKKAEEEKIKQQYIELLRQQNEKKKVKKEDLIKYKHMQNADTNQETQLVGLSKNENTLAGKVDLEKVKEIRRAIRRRYASRRNLQKIFSAWDQDSKGQISIKNVYDMIKKMGINANLDECRVLVVSSDENHDNQLNLDEFCQLVFNDNQAMNIDLSTLPVLSSEEVNKILTAETSNLLKVDKNVKQQRHDNQLSLILKNKLSHLTSHLLSEDAEQHGFVNYERLEKAMKKLSIPNSILNEGDIKNLYDKYKMGEYKFDYNKFLNDLDNFEFLPQEIAKIKHQQEEDKVKKQSYIQKQIAKFEELKDDEKDINVFDCYNVDATALERYGNAKFKITNNLKRYFPTEKEFKRYLTKQLGQTEKGLSKIQISSQRLSTLIEDVFLNFGEKFQKSDLEGFLSSFVYNQHQQTPCHDVLHQIYHEDPKEWEIKLQSKLKKPPPPKEQYYHPDFPVEQQYSPEELEQAEKNEKLNNSFQHSEKDYDNKSQKSPTSKKNSEQINGDYNEGDGQHNDEIQENPQKQSQVRFQTTKSQKSKSSCDLSEKLTSFTGTNYWRQSAYNTKYAPHLQNVLQKLEEKVFCGSKKAYDVFKQFDKDQDGYISQKDMVQEIQKINALNNSETRTLLRYLYPDPSKGYVNFSDFSAKIRPGVIDNNQQGLQEIVPYTQPSRQIHEDYKYNLPLLRAARKSMVSQFDQSNYVPKGGTRYSGSPDFKNTFTNVQSFKGTGQFQNNEQRFNRSINHRVEFQKEEKLKKQQYQEARLEKKRQNNQRLEDRSQQSQNLLDQRNENNRKFKGMLQWTYEHRCHVQNEWK